MNGIFICASSFLLAQLILQAQSFRSPSVVKNAFLPQGSVHTTINRFTYAAGKPQSTIFRLYLDC